MYLIVLEAAARNHDVATFQFLLTKLENQSSFHQTVGQTYFQKVIDQWKENKLDSFTTQLQHKIPS